MKPLVFSEKSLDDLQAILAYIARDKPLAAVRFVDQIEQQCRALAMLTGLGTRREDLAEGLRLFSFRGFGIYFRDLPDKVRIERVLRGSMDVQSQHFDES
jgi:toxin ParE1/3/4